MFARNLSLLSRIKPQIHNAKRNIAKIKLHDCPKPIPPMNVTILGASSNVGQISALLFKRQKIFKNILLYDDVSTSGLACDLNHINTTARVGSFCGTKSLQTAITHARIVYICKGIQTFPGISEKHLFEKNVDFVRQVIMYCAEFSPHSMIVIVSPPVGSLVPMAIEEFKRNDVEAGHRVFGLVKTYSSRANALCGLHLNIDPSKSKCLVVGGSHRRTIIPVFSQNPNGANLKRANNEMITKAAQEAEEDVLYEKKDEGNNQGCFLSIAKCGVAFCIALAQALNGASDKMECAFVKQDNPPKEYPKEYPNYLTTCVKLGKKGIEFYHIPKLSKLEKCRLSIVLDDIAHNIHMGETYVTGNDLMPKHRPKPEEPKKKPCCEEKKEPKKEEECKKIKAPKTMKVPA